MDKDYYKTRIGWAICYIENHLENRISLKEIAGVAMISSCYFHRLFKQETGCTPLVYHKQKRMQKAYNTLCSGEPIEIQDIWIELGYTSSSHFAKDFRDHFGCNPSECKRRFNASAKP